MGRVLEVAERRFGERCCDRTAVPRVSLSEATALAGDFDILANPIRLQLLDVLARNEGRVCVCDLEAAVPVKQPTVSHHLRVLREGGFIDSEKVGQWVYYRVRREALRALRQRITRTLDAIG
jgi:ArsR family transcriptional regulator